MAITKMITAENSTLLMLRVTLKDTGSHTEEKQFDVNYCVCDVDDPTFKKSKSLVFTVVDPTADTLTQILDAVRAQIKTTEEME